MCVSTHNLELINEHTERFKQHLLTENPDDICKKLLSLCHHTNKDVRVTALDAADAWLGQLATVLEPTKHKQHKEILLALWATCKSKLDNDEVRVRCLALRGCGALAKAAKDLTDISEIWRRITEQVKLILIQIHTDTAELEVGHVLHIHASICRHICLYLCVYILIQIC